MPVEGDYECYSDDWQRTNPDLVLNLPKHPPRVAEHQDHILVDYTPGGDLLAIWWIVDQSIDDMGVFFARSSDHGRSWTEPAHIHEHGPEAGHGSSFGFPVMSKSGRIYVYYNRSKGIGQGILNSVLRCRYSDDDGRTWIDGGVEFEYRRSKWDNPNPTVPPIGVVWQKPIRDARGRHVVALTRTVAQHIKPAVDASYVSGGDFSNLNECRSEFLRFDNIDDGPDPKDVKITWLPDDEDLIYVPVTWEPQASQGLTFCQEPGLVLLPDGRLFTEMRTTNGQIWYTVSDDHGHSWRPTEIMRFQDGGNAMLNPIAPSPMFALEDGRFLVFLQNHDGWGYGGRGPLNLNSRRPQFLSVGEFRPNAHQPVWFSEPLLLFDTDNVGVYPLYMRWLSMYASLTEREGRRTFWYTDRKLFALGRYITDEMLAPLTVPS